MKKLYFFLFLFFLISTLFSQEKYGEIIYSVSKEKSKKNTAQSNKNIEVSKLISTIDEKINNLNLVLEFSSKESYFKTELPLNLNYQEELIFKIVTLTINANSDIYVSLNDKIILEKKEFLGEEFLIHKRISKNIKGEWMFLSETKKIMEYNCYKATRNFSFTRNGKIETREQVVWYAPEIPIQFGPIEFVGFPGLVLEVKDGNFIYIAKKISLNYNKISKIEKPTRGKKVTKEEYDKICKEESVYFKRN